MTVDAARCLATLERERITESHPAYQPVMESVLAAPGFVAADLSSIRILLNVAPPEVLARFQPALPHAVQMATYGGTECGPATVTPGRSTRRASGHLRLVPAPHGGARRRRRRPAAAARRAGPHRGPRLQHPRRLLEGAGEDGRDAPHRRVGVPRRPVVGVPDGRLVEVPAAFVELVPGGQATEAELIEHCRGRIASFKVPRVVRFVEPGDWPMSATKIQRFRLRDRLLAEPAAAGRQDP